MLSQQEIADRAQLEKFRAENELMRKIGTTAGFFNYYFEILPKHRTHIETFNDVNEQHFELYGEYKYSSHSSFLTVLKRYRTK